jgi:hypothetical protein
LSSKPWQAHTESFRRQSTTCAAFTGAAIQEITTEADTFDAGVLEELPTIQQALVGHPVEADSCR